MYRHISNNVTSSCVLSVVQQSQGVQCEGRRRGCTQRSDFCKLFLAERKKLANFNQRRRVLILQESPR
ncbi:hypothetical protein GDO81_025715 [Engystomops pustulosus]|uniref:Uncharacterized protein n=1 Tax=Engystomops pustulosus TaxID=76066 RepID=A0AAV6YI45_ENGPU|nr:hypothetical protein GDO81_025715 [Engystomops pustulosus]